MTELPHPSAKPAWLPIAQVALATIVISVICLVRFSPHYVLWRGLDVPEAWIYPETNRANDTLRQLAHPTVQIEDDNRIVNGRLLFPVLGHALGLSRHAYLAIPFIGCLLAIGLTIHYVRSTTNNWPVGLLAGVLAATSSWFFCSTDWLGYCDSWFIVSALLVAFSPSRWLLAAACLLGPWVDERATILLPLAVLVRLLFLQFDGQPLKQMKRDVLFIGLCSLPYAVIRPLLWPLLQVGGRYFFSLRKVDLPHYGVPWQGGWMAIRAGWLFVALVVFWTYKRQRPIWTAALIAVLVPTAACGMLIAGDVARSMAIFYPMAVLGIILLAKINPRRAVWVAAAVAAINLIAPAAQSTMLWDESIPTLWGAMDELRHPPQEVDPLYYNARGVAHLRQGELDQAEHDFDTALTLNPQEARALVNRAILFARRGQMAQARGDADAAVAAAPYDADILLVVGLQQLQWGDVNAARSNLESAEAVADRDWPRRDQCRKLLAQLEAPK